MQFIHAANEKEGVAALASHISSALHAHKKVLWLICGGSNIPFAKVAVDAIRSEAGERTSYLGIGQTDERFGPVGHKDSNWQQMLDAGFDFSGTHPIPMLRGKALKETARDYAKQMEEAFAYYDLVVAQFGIGADGHVAGMLPGSSATEAKELVFGYEAGAYVRLTLTPPAFKNINAAYTFAFGESKREAIKNLQEKNLSLKEEPAQILKTIPKSYFYSDQI